jgi:acetyltransferase-like isoleucine patch superfamily enzyme
MAASGRRLSGSAFLSAHRFWTGARDKAFSLLAGGAFASFGRNSVLQLPVTIWGERRIVIGDDVFVGAGSWLRVIEASGEVAIVIGDGTSISGDCVLSAAQSIRLGRNVLLGRYVHVSDHTHAYTDPERAVLHQGIAGVAPVEIGDGAWLGQAVVVGPGVRIGRGAVVGANSVVLDDVPDHSVVVGAPARLVRQFAQVESVPRRS